MQGLVCTTEADIKALLNFIDKEELLTYDTETTGLNVHTDAIIGFGISNSTTAFYLPLLSYQSITGALSKQPMAHHCSTILQELKKKKLIMHNASFDVRMTKNNLGIDLLPALYADTMLMKHTCDENHPMGLKEIATMLWGKDVKKEKEEMQASIKANGGTATQYYKADTAIIGKYCMQDCALTFRVYSHYSAELERQGLVEFYYDTEVLPLYKNVTVPMEQAGVRLDIPLMNKTLAEISRDITYVEDLIQGYIAPHLALFTTWFLNKDYPLQTPTGKVPAWAKNGATQLQAWQKDNSSCYMFNLQSKFHLKKLFFDTLKETPLSTTPTGLPQVDDDFITSMHSKYPWCVHLTTYNKLQKLRSTYIQGMLEEAHEGRFYASYKQHGTTSGRYSGDMQQLPRPIEGAGLVARYTSLIRSFILADTDCSLISSDYQQLEPSVFAHVSGDATLQNIFINDLDFYSEIAIHVEGLKDVSSIKDAPNFLGKVNKAKRQDAKTYSLGIPYGMTGFKLKFEIGCSAEQADKLVQQYLSRFPALASWMLDSKEQMKKFGTIKTQAGRIRRLGRAAQLYKQYGPALDCDLQLWKAFNESPRYAQAKKDRREYKNYLNNGINFQIQGLGASIINRASIAIAATFKDKGMQTRQVGQIHDELLFNSPAAEVDFASAIIKQIMENITKLAVPLRANPVAASHFGACK